MTLKEPDIYERLGATGALVGILVALSKLGVFRRIREWWKRPTEGALLRSALHDLSLSQEKLADAQTRQCAALDNIASTLSGIGDSMIVTEAMMQFLGDREATPLFRCELPSGRCVWTNKALQTLFGRTREQMLGFGWVEAIEPSHQERVISHWKNSAVNSEVYNVSYPIERDGRLINVRAHADFIRDEKTGRRIVALGSIRPQPTLAEEAA